MKFSPSTYLLTFVLMLDLAIPAQSSAQESSGRASNVAESPDFWSDSRRGWHFYEDPESPPAIRPAAENDNTPTQQPATPARAPELIEFERLQKNMEEYRNIAIIKPTEANVRRYMELEAKVVWQASYFADVAQRIAWTTPELDPTLKGRPVNAKALEVFDQEQAAQRIEDVAALGKDHVLFFFFRSDCPYCHAFAPILASFQSRYHIRVVGVSVDGGPMPGFPDAKTDNGIAHTLNVTQVPAVFLAQPFTGQITPVGFGVLSESQLLERIATISAPSTDAMMPSVNKHVVLR